MGGGGSKATVESVLSAVQESFTQTTVNINNTCKSSVAASNSMSISNAGNSDNKDIISQCLQKYSPSKCDRYMAQQDVSDVSMSNKVKVTTNCTFNTQQTQDLQTQMAADLTSTSKNTTDGFTQMLNTLAAGITGGSNTATSYKTNVNMVSQVFSTDICNKAAQAIGVSQTFNISNIGLAKQRVTGLKLDSQTEALMTIIMENTTMNKAVNDLKAKVKQDNTTQQKGLTDLFETAAGMWTKMMGNWQTALIVLAVIGLAIIWAASRFLQSDAGQEVAKKLGDSAAKKIDEQFDDMPFTHSMDPYAY
jgi:hypothetical protein